MNYFRDLYYVSHRRADAAAIISGSEKYPDIHGSVLFYQLRHGVIICTEVINLPSNSEVCYSHIFAFHIHSCNRCEGNGDDYFADAGMHYNPNNCPHPYHAGDLPPLFGVDGKALSVFLTDRFTVREIIGKTAIIHSSADDFTTQPSGNAGEKIACGVITATTRERKMHE